MAAEVDEGQIAQVIHNLIINADQAMPNGGTSLDPVRKMCTWRRATRLRCRQVIIFR
jgi:signal transduction histidine kinase